MKKLLLLTKTLLAAALLCVGQNAWGDPIETIGSLSSGWWTDFSNTYTLEGYGKYHFQFTTTNANDGVVHKTWLLVATDGNDSHGGGGSEYFVWRGEGYAWGQGTSSNDTPTKLVVSNTYATANPTGAGIQAAMNGAAVDMVITRESNNIYATATVTPTNGENEFTMSFSYLYGNATSANVGLFLTVENAQVVLNTAEQTSKWTTVWNADFSSAPAGITYSLSGSGTINIDNGYLFYKDSDMKGRNSTLSFTDAAFNVDTDWIMEFDWNCGRSNSNNSSVTFATNNGNAFTFTWGKLNTDLYVTVTDAGSTTLSTAVPTAGYNIGSISTWNHVVIKGDKVNGIYLTITNGGITYVDNILVTATYGYPVSFNGTLGKAVSAMGVDNISFKTPAVAGFVATPTSEITGAAGTSRKFTLSCLTDGATIYYATSDLEKGAAGWEEYTGEVTTAATTIYAYAKDDEDNTSDKMNFATGAGTTIDLLPATVTHSNNGVYTIASNQSAILGAPTATIHYQIDGGSEQTSTNASVNVNIAADGTLTYWLTADGYGATDPENETVYAAVGYAATITLNFCTSSTNQWAYGNSTEYDMSTIVVATENTDRTYYKYLDQSSNVIGDGLLAVSAVNGGSSWRIDQLNAGVHPYNKTEYVVLLGMKAGQLIQIAASSAPSSTSNLTAVPASTYTGTYTYTATADGEVIFSLDKNVVLKTIKLCATSVSATIGATGWTTFASPYALNLSSMTASTGEVTAYYASETSAESVTVLPTSSSAVQAGEGILLKGTAGATITIPVVASGSAIDGNLMVGCPTGATINNETANYGKCYVLGIESEQAVFQNVKDYIDGSHTVNIPAGKAYLNANASYGARSISIVFADDVTGVANVEAASEAKAKEGKFIENGKLVIVKNGQKFNAAGAKLY